MHDSVRIEYRDTVIQGGTVTDTLYLDSIIYYPKDRWFTKLDTSGNAEFRWLINQQNQLIGECIAKDRIINSLKSEVRILKEQNQEVKTIIPKPTFKQYLLKWLAILAAAIVGFVIGYFLSKLT